MKTISAFLTAALLLLVTPAPAQQPAEPENGEDLLAREAWFKKRYAFPGEHVPPGARFKAFQELELLKTRRAPLAGTLPSIWESIGPAPIRFGGAVDGGPGIDVSGRVNAIAVDPRDASHWIVGSPSGGIWQTRDAGKTWTPSTDDKANLSIGAIAIGGVDGAIVYAGTGDGEVQGVTQEGAGVYASTDGGATFTLLASGSLKDTRFAGIAIDSRDVRHVVGAVNSGQVSLVSGFVKSTDGGATWATKRQGQASDLAPDPTDPSRLYAALGATFVGTLSASNGVYRSTDAGDTWTQVPGEWGALPLGAVGRISVALAPTSPDRVYVSIAKGVHIPSVGDDGQLLGLWYTDNAWETDPANVKWTKIDTAQTNGGGMLGYCRKQCFYNHRLLVDYNDKDTLWAGGISLWKCTKCASSSPNWDDMGSRKLHHDQHALVQVPTPGDSGPLTFSKFLVDQTVHYCPPSGFDEKRIFSETVPFSSPPSCDPAKNGAFTFSGSGTVSSRSIPDYELNGNQVTLKAPLDVTTTVTGSWTAPNDPSDPDNGLVYFDIRFLVNGPFNADGSNCRAGGVTLPKEGEDVKAGETVTMKATITCHVDKLFDAHSDKLPFGSFGDSTYIEFSYRHAGQHKTVYDAFLNSIYELRGPTRLFVGNDGGLFSSTDGGGTFANHNTNLTITEFYSGSVHPRTPDAAIAGSQDNGHESYARNGSADEWRLFQTGDGGDSLYAYDDPAHQVIAFWVNKGIQRTLNGSDFSDAMNALNVNDLPSSTRLAECPANPEILLTGTNTRVFRNNLFFGDGAADGHIWLANGPTTPFANPVTALAFAPPAAPMDCSTYVAGASAATTGFLDIQRTTDGGTTWKRLATGGQLPNRDLTHLEFDPANRNVLWASFGGFNVNGAPFGHLFRTDNALSDTPTWTPVEPPLFHASRGDLPIHSFLVDPKNPGTVYIGSDMAVWRSIDNGASWTHMDSSNGMPNVAVRDIKAGNNGGIIAFTYGRGAFRLGSKTADLSITKVSDPTAVLAGKPVTYRITVKNNGPDKAVGVTVTDTPPVGFLLTSAASSQGACTGTSTIVCKLGELASGATATVTIVVTFGTAGTYENTASVTSAATDPNPANNTAKATTTVTDSAGDTDRSVVKSASKATVTVGDEITYTIVATNNGPAAATGVVVTDVLPPSVTLVSATASQGTCGGTGTVSCAIGSLAKGATATITIVVKTTTDGTLTNTATITGKENDPNGANNSSTATTKVEKKKTADLLVQKLASPTTGKVDETVTFVIVVSNNGPDEATGVTMVDDLPPTFTFVSASSTQGGCSGTTSVVCSIGTLASGASATVLVKATPAKAGIFFNTACATANEEDPNPGDSCSRITIDVLGNGGTALDRAITKGHTPQTAEVGGRLLYSIVARNNGPGTARGVSVVDVLPAGFAFGSASATRGSCGGGAVVTCEIGDLEQGSTATITIIGTATRAGTLTNSASILGLETDTNPGNDVATDVARVVAIPAVTKVTPASARQGTRNLELKIEGFNFEPGASVQFGPSTGIELVPPPGPNFGFVSTTEIHQVIHIASGAPLGERELRVTNPDGATGGIRPNDVFTITPGAFGMISVSAASLDFGSLTAKQTRDRTLTVGNAGSGPLTIRAIGAGSPFTAVSPAAPFVLAPGAQRDVVVRFAPLLAGAAAKALVISSTDGARPSVTVTLTGTATAPPILELAPAALNFGQVAIGASRTLPMKIRNKGNATLNVASLASDDLLFTAPLATPLNLAPGAEQSVDVTYAPTFGGLETAKLTLASNDPEQPSVTVQLRGEGAGAGTQSLATDDGTPELAFLSDGLTMVNRFTPPSYPAQLKRISVFVTTVQGQPSPAGKQVRLIAFAQPAGATPPGSPTPLLNMTVTLQAPSGAYQDFDVPNGPTVSSGDLYVGYVSPSPAAGVGFAADLNGSQQQRGWFSTNGGVTYGGPVVSSGNGAPANLMIRATLGQGASPCSWGIAPARLPIPKEGGSGTIDVTAPDGCPWSVATDSPFVSFSSSREPLAGGSGNGSVRYTIAPATSDATRSGKITIAQLDSSVIQSPVTGAAGSTRDVFVPIVLSTAGLNSSFFTSELTLTNRGTASAVLSAAYTAAFGGGGGTALDVLAPGTQRVYPDGLAYLKSIGVPIPDSGNRGGTVALTFSNPAVAATVRTTTGVPEGRAGLAYPGIPTALNGTVYLLGLRQNATDRSNVALMNAGTNGDVVLRLTVHSGDPAMPIAATLPDVALGPGGFTQLSGVLGASGLTLANGWVSVERVSGTAPYFAYGIINDQANSDGSFVPPVTADSLAGKKSITLPVVVEVSSFSTELIVTNFGSARKDFQVTFVADGVTAAGNATSVSFSLAPGEQKIVPDLVQFLRVQHVAGIGPQGTTFAGAAFLTVSSGDVSGLFIGARTSSPGGGGRYGLFYTGVPAGAAATSSPVYLYGLQQNAENRANVAFVNTGETDGSSDTLQVRIFDGDTGSSVATFEVTLGPKRWTQVSGFLSQYTPGVSNAYVQVTRTAGNNPFVAYAVVNDGGTPGQRSGDGAFVTMDTSN